MGKTIGSVILAYLMIVVVFFIVFVVASLLMRPEGSFRPGTYDVSTLWIVMRLVAVFFAGIVGGRICLAIARERRAAYILAIVVVVFELGLWLAVPRDDPGERPAVVTTLEAMQNARMPTWLALLNPLVGAAGVLTAASLKTRRKRA